MTIKLKTTASSTGLATLQHPDVPPGIDGDVITYAVNNVPEHIPAAEVVRLFNLTTILNGYIANFAQLAPGAILR